MPPLLPAIVVVAALVGAWRLILRTKARQLAPPNPTRTNSPGRFQVFTRDMRGEFLLSYSGDDPEAAKDLLAHFSKAKAPWWFFDGQTMVSSRGEVSS